MTARYFVCSRLQPPVEFPVSNDRPVPDAEISYFIRAFRLLEQTHDLSGYTVCFAWGSNIRLPEVGKHVIAVIYGDEHCRVPRYAEQVAAVFKCHGFVPNFRPRLRPLRLAQIELVAFLRDLALWVPSSWRYLLSSKVRNNCHLVPLGYGTPTELSVVPVLHRRLHISFRGSAAANSASRLRRSIGTPKAFCRRAMLEALRPMEDENPARAQFTLTSSFQESIKASTAYHEQLAETMICPAPRGTAHETLRLYEGLRLGCVVLADRLPRHPFYRNAPVIEIRDWRKARKLVRDLLADPNRLVELSRQSLSYWQDVLSEQALARQIADVLGLELNGKEADPQVRGTGVRQTSPEGRTSHPGAGRGLRQLGWSEGA